MKIVLTEGLYKEDYKFFMIKNKKNRKIGFVCLFFYYDYVEITNFFIRKSERGKGLAKKTLKKIKKIWKEKYSDLPLRLVPYPYHKGGLELDILETMYKKSGFLKIDKKDENDRFFFQLKESI